jgi:hypothetical protein
MEGYEQYLEIYFLAFSILYEYKEPRPPPLKIFKLPENEDAELQCDYSFFDDTALCDSL